MTKQVIPRESLTSKARFVAARLHDAEIRPRAYKTDVAIVTSSPQVELRELLKTPGIRNCEYNQADALHYYSSAWKTCYGTKISVVASAAPTMG